MYDNEDGTPGQLSETSGLKTLGQGATSYATDKVTPEVLESFPNPLPKPGEYRGGTIEVDVELEQHEFTSLCPKTGQPDYARITIAYVPRDKCVESKSLKLYLGSYRNVGEFAEACSRRMLDDMITFLNPYALYVRPDFAGRGGITIGVPLKWVANDA